MDSSRPPQGRRRLSNNWKELKSGKNLGMGNDDILVPKLNWLGQNKLFKKIQVIPRISSCAGSPLPIELIRVVVSNARRNPNETFSSQTMFDSMLQK